MKLFSLLSVAAVSAFSFSAFAADGLIPTDHLGKEKKVLKFDIACKFEDKKDDHRRDIMGGKDDGKDEGQDDKHGDRCFAAATIFKKIDDKKGGHDYDDLLNDHEDDEMDGDGKKDRFKNRFAVFCNKSLEYADGAKVSKKNDAVRIAGIPGYNPVLTLYTDRHDDLSQMDAGKKVDAKLERKHEDDLRGSCKVRVTKLNNRY